MPITIAPPGGQAGLFLGPGVVLTLSSDFIGPFPTGTTWTISLTSDSEGTHEIAQTTIGNEGHQITIPIGKDTQTTTWSWPGLSGIGEGNPVYVQARIDDANHNPIDSGTQQFPWSIGAAGLATQGQSAGSFTAQDRASLTNVEAWTALDTFITALTLEDLGVAPPGGQLAAQMPEWRYGIIVRLTQIPPELSPQTPDLDYWVKTLAVVRVFRGTDILARIPIHRSSQIVPFVGNGMALQIAAVTVQLWAPGLSVEVDFLPGCAGQAFLMKLP